MIPELFCQKHQTRIQFFDIRKEIPLGERALCSKCQLQNPCELETGIVKFKELIELKQADIKMDKENCTTILLCMKKQLQSFLEEICSNIQTLQTQLLVKEKEYEQFYKNQITQLNELETNDYSLTKLQEIGKYLSQENIIFEEDDNLQSIESLNGNLKYITSIIKQIRQSHNDFLHLIERSLQGRSYDGFDYYYSSAVDNICKVISCNKYDTHMALGFDKKLNIAESKCELQIWVIKEPKEIKANQHIYIENANSIYSMKFSNINNNLIIGTDKGQIIMFNEKFGIWRKGQMTQIIQNPSVFSLLLLFDTEIIAGCSDSKIYIYQRNELQKTQDIYSSNINLSTSQWTDNQTLSEHSNAILAMSSNQNNSQFVSCSNEIIVWNKVSQNLWNQVQKIAIQASRITFINDNQFVIQQLMQQFSIVFAIKDKSYQQIDQIQLTEGQKDENFCPSEYVPNSRIMFQKYGNFIYLIEHTFNNKFKVVQSFKYQSSFIYGCISNKGDLIALFDQQANKIKMYSIKYKY